VIKTVNTLQGVFDWIMKKNVKLPIDNIF